MNNQTFWNAILQHIESTASPLVLYVVVASKKGSPGNPGFAMTVAMKGEKESVIGTIGGGIMEQSLINEAVNSLRKGEQMHWIRTLQHRKRETGTSSASEDFTPSGLICAGSQTVVACTLTLKDTPTLSLIGNATSNNTPLVMQLSPTGIAVRFGSGTDSSVSFSRFSLRHESVTDWLYEELLGAPDTVVIAGGGHVGLALSRQMALLGWYVLVCDDREHLETMTNNTVANERITQPYEQLGSTVSQQIHTGRRTFVVVATTAYNSDITALRALAKMPEQPEYIGIMGSRAKIHTIFREAEVNGVSRKWLQTLHAPIGVGINSDTPEEIAVSIAAELIGVKNAR